MHVWAHHSRKATSDALTIDGHFASLTHHESNCLTDHADGVVDPTPFPSLRLAIDRSARVALTKNIDYKVGTFNDASGTLVALEYKTNITDQASRIYMIITR